ncbi:CPBP family intramembrane glutamic endopeptidase [Deinococcota bacterium DY0809b]
MPKPASWIRRHPLVSYFVLAFAITWILLLPLAAGALGWWPYRISPHGHFLGGLGPLLAAWIVTGTSLGKAGLTEFTGRWRRMSAFWLAVAGLSPLLLFLASSLVLRLAGEPWPDFGKLANPEFANPGWILGSLLSAVIYGFGEEAGWRGFALPRLQSRRGALAATLVLAVFWALWHAPMFLYRFDFGPGEIVGFFLGLLAGAVWLTFLYNSSGGSILTVAVWHTAWNAVNIVGMVVSVGVVALMSALVMLAALVIVPVWGPARLSTGAKRTFPE